MQQRIKVFVLAILSVLLIGIVVILNMTHDKNSAKLEKLVRGDYTGLHDESMEQTLSRIIDRNETEWVYYDLNADGEEDLVLQEKEYESDILAKRIVAVFTVRDNEVVYVIWDISQPAEFYFLYDGKLFYHGYYYGTYIYDSYCNYQYNAEWDINLVERYEYFNIYSMDEMPSDWSTSYPNLAREGIYYIRTTDTLEESITEQEFMDGLGFFRIDSLGVLR